MYSSQPTQVVVKSVSELQLEAMETDFTTLKKVKEEKKEKKAKKQSSSPCSSTKQTFDSNNEVGMIFD
jgi:hypothetical protein